MKTQLIFSLLLIGRYVLAQEPVKINVTCATSSFLTTTFAVSTKETEVSVRVIHHNGVKYAPSLSGTYTPNDLKYLQDKAQTTLKLADDTTFQWDIKKCSKQDEVRFHCSGSTQVIRSNGVKIEPWSMAIDRVTLETVLGNFSSYRALLTLTVDGKEISIEAPYESTECVKTSDL